MSTLTPERIRDAAEVLRLLDTDRRPGDPEYSWMPSQVEKRAKDLERQIADEEAKREKRIEELAQELYGLYVAGRSGKARWVDAAANPHHVEAARALLERYPALADPGPCDKGPCCLSNHHEGRCEL